MRNSPERRLLCEKNQHTKIVMDKRPWKSININSHPKCGLSAVNPNKTERFLFEWFRIVGAAESFHGRAEAKAHVRCFRKWRIVSTLQTYSRLHDEIFGNKPDGKEND